MKLQKLENKLSLIHSIKIKNYDERILFDMQKILGDEEPIIIEYRKDKQNNQYIWNVSHKWLDDIFQKEIEKDILFVYRNESIEKAIKYFHDKIKKYKIKSIKLNCNCSKQPQYYYLLIYQRYKLLKFPKVVKCKFCKKSFIFNKYGNDSYSFVKK